jgi:predicted membrane protein
MDPRMDLDGPATEIRITPRLVIGLAIMLAGLVLALDSLGLVDGSVVFRFWPLVLVAVGIVKWVSPPRQLSAGLVWIVAGVGLLLVTFGRMSFAGVWALILLFVGANIAWRALRPAVPSGDPAATLDMTAVLGGAKTVSHATDFRGGQALATMGGCEIDLRHASIAEGREAVIDTFAFWGGIEIKVPDDWDVVNRGSAFLGGFENKTRPAPGSRKRLVVTGTAIMGGVEVKN